MRDDFYTSREWLEIRDLVLERDGHRCTVAQLLGGDCAGRLHVHHIEPREERPDRQLDPANLATACAAHHPRWEALRRALVRERDRAERPYRCPHPHRSADARRQCEAQRAREMGLVPA